MAQTDSDPDLDLEKRQKIPYWTYLLDQAPITPEILNWGYRGSGTNDDPYIVSWIESDPRDPMRMPLAQKSMITLLAGIVTLAAAFMSSSYSGAISQVMEDLQVGEEVAVLGISLYVLGFAVGPLIWAPLGELYGRQIILFITYGIFTAFNAGAAGAKNIQTLVVLRFLAGSASASSMTNTGGTIADMFEARQRGIAIAVFAIAPFMGPVFGPMVGGYLGQAAGWRWVQGLTAIFSGVLWILSALLIPETYAPLLLRKRAKRLSEMTGKVYLSAADARAPKNNAHPLWTPIKEALTRPWSLIVHEPSLLFLAVYMSILYGILYMLFGAMPIVFQEGRHWDEGKGGLAFLGVAVGEIAACLYCIPENLRYIRLLETVGKPPPEERLIPAMVGAIASPIGLFWFAWTNGSEIHPLVSIAAGAPFGFGMVLVFVSVKNYLVDTYLIFSASALAATVVMRSVVGAAFPLFTVTSPPSPLVW